MKYYYAVIDNGGDREEGVISESDFESFDNLNHGCEIHVILSIEELETILKKMKTGKTDLTINDLKELAGL